MSATTLPQGKCIRPAAAAEKLSIGLSTLWLKAKKDPSFPKPFKTGPHTTVFLESEVDEYIAVCISKSRSN
jgi:prophage regulatory protein